METSKSHILDAIRLAADLESIRKPTWKRFVESEWEIDGDTLTFYREVESLEDRDREIHEGVAPLHEWGRGND